MTERLTRLMPALLVAIATMAWAQYVSAAIVVNSDGFQFASGGMSAPDRPTDVPSRRLDRHTWDSAVLEGLLSHAGAGAPPTTSSVTSAVAAAVLGAVDISPPPVVRRFFAYAGWFLPEPAPCRLFRPPRPA